MRCMGMAVSRAVAITLLKTNVGAMAVASRGASCPSKTPEDLGITKGLSMGPEPLECLCKGEGKMASEKGGSWRCGRATVVMELASFGNPVPTAGFQIPGLPLTVIGETLASSTFSPSLPLNLATYSFQLKAIG